MNSSVFGSDSQPGLTLLATGRQDCSDLHSWGPGVRPVYIIHYILRGQGFIDYHKKTFPVHTGESFLIYPYDTIRYYPDPGNPWEYTWVEFTGKEAASLLDQTAFSPAAPVCPAICPARLRQLFADLQPLEIGNFNFFHSHRYKPLSKWQNLIYIVTQKKAMGKEKMIRQHRIIPALRLKHRSGSCRTSLAVSALRIMRYCHKR